MQDAGDIVRVGDDVDGAWQPGTEVAPPRGPQESPTVARPHRGAVTADRPRLVGVGDGFCRAGFVVPRAALTIVLLVKLTASRRTWSAIWAYRCVVR